MDQELEQISEALQALRPALTRALLAREERRRRDAATLGERLSGPQHLTLLALAEGPLGMGDLAARTGVAVSTATRMVQGLGRLGLVASCPGPDDDRRRRSVALTASGRREMDRASAAHAARVRRLLEPLSPARRREILRGLTVFLEAIAEDERRLEARGRPATTGNAPVTGVAGRAARAAPTTEAGSRLTAVRTRSSPAPG
jgi:DNA-binding MarR family transcriptional regulator